MKHLNWRRGLFRIWLTGSIMWILYVFSVTVYEINEGPNLPKDNMFRDLPFSWERKLEMIGEAFLIATIPPLALAVVSVGGFYVIPWIAKGFRA